MRSCTLVKPITALIITRNEADNIKRTVESVRELAAEVLVIDSGSTDDTRQIASNAGARVMEHAWPGFGAQKNWGASQANHNWILSIDADEVPDDKLKAQLLRLDLDPNKVYGFRRITNFCGTWVKHGSWKRDIVWRLYHRDYADWDERKVHENLHSKHAPERLIVSGNLLHYSYPTLESHDKKLEVYTRLGAESLFAQGKRSSWHKRTLAPVWRAIRGYLVLGGWKDGWAGREIARRDFSMVRQKYRLLDELWKNSKQP